MQDPRYRRIIRCPVAILRMPFDAEGRIAAAAGRRARPVMVDDALRAFGFDPQFHRVRHTESQQCRRAQGRDAGRTASVAFRDYIRFELKASFADDFGRFHEIGPIGVYRRGRARRLRRERQRGERRRNA